MPLYRRYNAMAPLQDELSALAIDYACGVCHMAMASIW